MLIENHNYYLAGRTGQKNEQQFLKTKNTKYKKLKLYALIG